MSIRIDLGDFEEDLAEIIKKFIQMIADERLY